MDRINIPFPAILYIFLTRKDTTYIKISLTILGMIVGVSATGLVAALSMSEPALAQRQGSGGGCGSGGCGGDIICCATEFNGGGGGSPVGGTFGGGGGFGNDENDLFLERCGISHTQTGIHGSC
jgi:hypothetical protein